MIYDICANCEEPQAPSKQRICFYCRTESRPKFPCARCQHVRPVHRRIEDRTYCKSCSLYYREKRPCAQCTTVSRIVAHGLCNSCYNKWKAQYLPYKIRENDFIENTYEKKLFIAAKTSAYMAIKFGELMATKKKRTYHVQMIAHGTCFLCDNAPECHRIAGGIRVELCNHHYYTTTLGDLTARVRTLTGATLTETPSEKDENELSAPVRTD